MTDRRTIKDRLQEEYFDLLPEIRRVTEHLEAVVRYRVLSILRTLKDYERLVRFGHSSAVSSGQPGVTACALTGEGHEFPVSNFQFPVSK
jgi:hypothetical protein